MKTPQPTRCPKPSGPGTRPISHSQLQQCPLILSREVLQPPMTMREVRYKGAGWSEPSRGGHTRPACTLTIAAGGVSYHPILARQAVLRSARIHIDKGNQLVLTVCFGAILRRTPSARRTGVLTDRKPSANASVLEITTTYTPPVESDRNPTLRCIDIHRSYLYNCRNCCVCVGVGNSLRVEEGFQWRLRSKTAV